MSTLQNISLSIVPREPQRPAHLIRVAVPRLNKQDWISEYLKQLESRHYDLNWAEVIETKVLTVAEWNELMQNLLEDREWLAGKGGASSWADVDFNADREEWIRCSYLHVVAVQCAGQTIYIDPEGYDYARYVAFAADGLPEGKTRQEEERERAQAEVARKAEERAQQIANPPTVPEDHGLRFLWNGIKVKGELYRCWYSFGNTHHYPEETVSVSARDYKSFPAEVRACFHVENNSDHYSDYFDNDHLRVCPNHPLYALAKAAYDAQEAHHAKTIAKRRGN